MKTYVVGGAVRDRLLGRPVVDRDHVVVGATPDQMRASGFIPVGRDFPVFLHPETHEEYALARTERKTAPGYAGFIFHADPSVTLEQDLARRDLTINAMAEDDDGRIIDPFGGRRDLAAHLFRHVGPAFTEDPVRILRAARFAARFTDFTLVPATAHLMRSMVDEGEVDALIAERVWQEWARGLMEARPSRMLEILSACGALARLAPEVTARQASRWPALDTSADRGAPLAVRFAVWMSEAGVTETQLLALCDRMRVPNDCRELALLFVRERHPLDALTGGSPAEDVLGFLERSDGLRRPERLDLLLNAFDAFAPQARQRDFLNRALAAIRGVDAARVTAGLAREHIPLALRAARLAALGRLDDFKAP